jgi:hypothetical protein
VEAPIYGLARAALYGEAADLSTLFQGNGSSLPSPCQNDLAALGVTATQISQAASNVAINNGVTSTANYALAIFGNSPAYNANAAVYGNMTIAQYMACSKATWVCPRAQRPRISPTNLERTA